MPLLKAAEQLGSDTHCRLGVEQAVEQQLAVGILGSLGDQHGGSWRLQKQ